MTGGRFTVSRFVAADLAALTVRPEQAGELRWFEVRRAGEEYAAAGNAFTIRSFETRPAGAPQDERALRAAPDGAPQGGRVIFCGGAIERHPQYATLWGLFGEDIDWPAARFMVARTRLFIDGLPHRRVDALVEERPAAIRYALRIGLRPEARLAAATLEGKDMLVFRRVEEAALADAMQEAA